MISQGVRRMVTSAIARRHNSPAGATQAVARTFSSTAKKMSEELGGVPGENLPFNIYRPWRLTLGFVLYCGSALSLPFIIVRYQLLK